MKSSLPEIGLNAYHGQFSRDHAARREQLLRSLPEASWQADQVAVDSRRKIRSTMLSGVNLRYVIRTGLAAAAVFMLVFGLMFYKGPESETPQAAWAAAIEQANQVQTVHFKLSTPQSSVEMWCRNPKVFEEYRIEYSNGQVTTGNREMRCYYSQRDNTLTIRSADTPALERMLLGELGGLFTSDNLSLTGDLINDSKILQSSNIYYKGETCLKVIAEMKGDRFEYILDKREPLIYEVKRFGPSGGLRSHMEIMEVNREMADDQFTVSSDGKTVKDRRMK